MNNLSDLPTQFTIRVYGILLDESMGVLVADEFQNGRRFTKFPGGGLELGEGTRDCLVREWREELNQRIEVTEHFYTTDFYQISAFDNAKQVISIYYRVKPLEKMGIKISALPFDFAEEKDGAESFRWIAAGNFQPALLTFSIDKLVAKMIQAYLQQT
ncbi:MAG: NUDIX domain-containing protein [Chitinophagales bacterium]